MGSGISDEQFTAAGATIVPTAADAWAADMVMKVKELRLNISTFVRAHFLHYLHLAPTRPDEGAP